MTRFNHAMLAALLASCSMSICAQTTDFILVDQFEPTCGVVAYSEDFPSDGPNWPAPWQELANSAAVADVSVGMGRMQPQVSGYSLGRLYADVPTRDVEVRFLMVLEDATAQGVGFYVRQNGGHLNQTFPTGEGYAVFVEGSFRGMPGVGVWREEDGHEIQIAHSGAAAAAPTSGVPFRVRFRVHQLNATQTLLQAKIWPDAAAEPVAWQVSAVNNQPSLQGATGGIAVDSWNSATAGSLSAHTLIDQIEIEPLCNPIRARGAVQTISESFQFTEGPLWRGDHLLFTDIPANTIVRLDPPAAISSFRTPSDQANGLALNNDGLLLAAEHASRRVSLTIPGGSVQTLVEFYQGLRFNSPNDLAVADDGDLYFTDPDYGLANPGLRELAFNGLFRVDGAGAASAEWEGTIGVNQPNGVALSPDQSIVYVTDTQAGTLLAWDRQGDGSLTSPRVLASGLPTPDGMCIDDHGNVYVATWGNGIEIYSRDGARWGSIAIPRAASNCAFGGPGRSMLYVTAHEGLYSVHMPVPGTPY